MSHDLTVYRFKVIRKNKKKNTMTGIYVKAGVVASNLIKGMEEDEIRLFFEAFIGPIFKIEYPPGWSGPRYFEFDSKITYPV